VEGGGGREVGLKLLDVMVGVVIIALRGGVCGAVTRADCRCCGTGDTVLGGAGLQVSGAGGNKEKNDDRGMVGWVGEMVV